LDFVPIRDGRLEIRADDRPLALEGLPLVLDMEDTPQDARSAQSATGTARHAICSMTQTASAGIRSLGK
jgi:hypothetical protein